VSVINSKALASAASFRVFKGVNNFNSFSQVTWNVTHNLEKLILIEAFLGKPKSNILVASRVFGVRFEFSDFASLELIEEARISTPEQSDILYVKQFHGPSLKSETESPANFILNIFASVSHNAIVNNTWTENLKPLVVIENFQLDRGLREREIGIDPTHLNIAEYMSSQIFKYLLEVSFSNNLGFLDIFSTDFLDSIGANTLHLMECRIVSTINSVLTIDITDA